MPIAIAQMRRLLAAPRKNKVKMLALIDGAKGRGADLIVFPELALSGPLYDDMVADAYLLEECRQAAMEIAAFAQGIAVIFGSLGIDDAGRPVSRAYLADSGVLKPIDAAAPALFAENTPYLQASEGRPIEIMLDGRKQKALVLLGDWADKELPKSVKDADLALNLSPKAISFDGSYAKRPFLDLPYIEVGSVGLVSRHKANYLLAGHSCYYDAKGQLIASLPYFKEDLALWRPNGGAVNEIKDNDALLAQALSEGAREFCLAIHARRAVIGISGGIDSALAACVYRQALGSDNVYLVSMPTIFNSETTKALAAGMAKGLDLPLMTIPLDASLEQFYDSLTDNAFVDAVGGKTQIELSGPVKENIMARERARVLAATAAGRDAIFSCNGNKAELTVGYATFYGDLAGAFAAQADLWKYQVYAASRHFQTVFSDAPLDQIAAIRPSAELSLAQDINKGLGDPLVYAYHDYLLKSWVEGGKTPTNSLQSYLSGSLAEDIGCEHQLISELFPDRGIFIADLEYWWKMYRGIGVAKRLQAPPLLALSCRPFGDAVREVQGAVFFDEEFERLKRS